MNSPGRGVAATAGLPWLVELELLGVDARRAGLAELGRGRPDVLLRRDLLLLRRGLQEIPPGPPL